MKRLLLLFLLCITHSAIFAQTLKSENYTLTNMAEMRIEANFSKHFKIRNQGIHVELSQEVYARLYESTYSQTNNSTNTVSPYFRRSYTSVGIKYVPNNYLHVGAEYTLKIMGNKFTASDGTPNSADEFIKHRVSGYVSGQYVIDDWKFSLRERLDANMRMDSVNLHERPQTTLLLRHKIQAQYTVPGKPIKAYAFVELWNTLNQPVKYINTYSGKKFEQYISDVHLQAGIKWRADKLNTIGVAYRYAYGYTRDVNITHTKSNIEITHARGHGHYLILTYDLDW